MAVSPARLAAFNILLRVEREAAYAVELLHSSLLEELQPLDRNLATEIVMGVLRWRSVLDGLIARLSFTPFRKLDLEVLIALRIGIYQKQFLSKVPAHAAVNESVELVKQAKKVSAAPLVNAVMRKVKSAAYDPRAARPAGIDYLSSALAHPKWLAERWTDQFGSDQASLICEYDQRVPPTVLRLSAVEDERWLGEQGIQLSPGALLNTARVVTSGDLSATTLPATTALPTATALPKDGRIAIQDEGSQLVAALVGNGRRILDCCAAPGGKTAAMATRLPEAEIVATELHPHRARLLRTLAPQPNVQVLTADALNLPYGAEFDRVLADVPCSGTGTLARNPEIKWRLKPEDLGDLETRQIAILRAAMRYLASGGRLVYSTCSLEPEENEQVVSACLKAESGFQIIPVRDALAQLQKSGELVWPNIDQLVSGNFLRTLPGVHPCDGFFAAILEKS